MRHAASRRADPPTAGDPGDGVRRPPAPAGRLPAARPRVLPVLLALLAIATSSCSIRRMAVKSVANSLTSGPDVYATDDDPELVREAIPFGLKTMESLLATLPRHRGLLLGLCRGFTLYGAAFIETDADALEATDYGRASATRERALKLYLRARDYGLRGLELDHRGITQRLQTMPDPAAREIRAGELPMLYWTAAAWGSAINLGKDRAELLADLGAVRALMERGLALDETYDEGAFHEAMIVLEALPRDMGGSPERAREHFRRAVALSEGRKASPYVTLAQSVSVMTQDRREFRELLETALSIDPDRVPSQRLATLVVQRQARHLLEREDDLFLESDDPNPGKP